MKLFTPSIYFLWIVSIALQATACALVFRRKYFAHWKAFGYYLLVMASTSALMLPLAIWGSTDLYAVTYAIVDFVEALLVSLVVLEILVRVLEPFETLPGRTVARFCFWAVLGISSAVVLTVVIPRTPGSRTWLFVDLPLTLERTIFLADAAILWVLLFQTKALGISWKSSVAEIAVAFVLYLTVQSTTRFVLGVYSNPVARNMAAEVGQFSYLIALGSWIWTMTHRDPIPPRPAEESVARIKELATDSYDAVPKERIFAAVGIRINKPTEPELVEENAPPIVN